MPLLDANQIEALKTAPLGGLANRLQIAFAMADAPGRRVRQADACAATGLSPSAMSKLVKGAYQSLDIEHARKLADYFGCAMEDLFPSRERSAVAS